MPEGEGNTLPWEASQQSPPAEPSAGGRSPLAAQREAAAQAGPLDERPEILVGAAFAGGLLLAQLLRRLGSDE